MLLKDDDDDGRALFVGYWPHAESSAKLDRDIVRLDDSLEHHSSLLSCPASAIM